MTFDQCIVNVTYCNTVEMRNEYDSPHDAIDRYTTGLKDAFEPIDHPKAPHVVRTWMTLVNSEDHIIHTIDSGVFACVHTTGQEEPLPVGMQPEQ